MPDTGIKTRAWTINLIGWFRVIAKIHNIQIADDVIHSL